MHTQDVKQKFFNSLKRGTGESYLLMKEHPDIDLSQLIIKGAIKNYAYDPQSEGSRADYIFRLFKSSQQKHNVVAAVLAKLQEEKEDWYALQQMCDLAVLFFKAGYKQAKPALLNRFNKNNDTDYAFCGQRQIIEVYGWQGLLMVAKTVGQQLYEDDTDYEDSYHVDQFQKQNKQLDVYEELKKAGKRNKYIKAYYESIVQHKHTTIRKYKPIRYSYELANERIQTKTFRVISEERANDLSEEEVSKLADDFLVESDKIKQELYLRFFTRRAFPYGYKKLLELANGKNPPKTRLVYFALQALSQFQAKPVRAFAVAQLSAGKGKEDHLSLLIRNYKRGDSKFLYGLVCQARGSQALHDLAHGIREIYTANKTRECKLPLEEMYKNINCGLCRADMVNILSENNVLSPEILAELAYDSEEGIRKFYKQQIRFSGT